MLPSGSFRVSSWAVLLRRLPAFTLIVFLACTSRAGAVPVKPWMPPHSDTLLTWATEARVRFQSNTGDSVGGDNYRAYELVARMGQHLLERMGRARMTEAYTVETILDSLGLDTEVSFDPSLPYFALLMVHNPFKRTAASVGYLYWYKQYDLKVQGVLFFGGREPKSRVWWTGDTSQPYGWGILDRSLADPPTIGLTYLRLDPAGNYWNLMQFAADTLNLGGPGDAEWVDINRDGIPEIASWVRGALDSSFVECSGCPEIFIERTLVDRQEGFGVEESRLVPTAFANFVLFVRLLQQGDRGGAARLVANPKMVDQALAWGWNRRGKGVWKYLYGENGEHWQRWMAFLHHGANGKNTTYVIHFGQAEGRWIIAGMTPVRDPSAQGGAGQ